MNYYEGRLNERTCPSEGGKCSVEWLNQKSDVVSVAVERWRNRLQTSLIEGVGRNGQGINGGNRDLHK